MQTMFIYIYIWKYIAHQWFWSHDTCIFHPFLWFSCVYWIPMSNSKRPMQFSKVLCKQLCFPNCFKKVFVLFKVHPCTLWDESHPPTRVLMMPNKISKVKCTNKGHLTYSICCAWAWSSSHSNSTFFFIQSRAFFSFHFFLACELLKIQTFIARWFCCFGPPTRVEGWPNLPTSMRSSCLLSKCCQNNHLAT